MTEQMDHPDDPPTDLVDLRRRFAAAETALGEEGRSLPSGADIAAGRAEISDEQRQRSAELYEEMRTTAAAIAAHPWITGAPDREKARQRLRAADS